MESEEKSYNKKDAYYHAVMHSWMVTRLYDCLLIQFMSVVGVISYIAASIVVNGLYMKYMACLSIALFGISFLSSRKSLQHQCEDLRNKWFNYASTQRKLIFWDKLSQRSFYGASVMSVVYGMVVVV